MIPGKKENSLGTKGREKGAMKKIVSAYKNVIAN